MKNYRFLLVLLYILPLSACTTSQELNKKEQFCSALATTYERVSSGSNDLDKIEPLIFTNMFDALKEESSGAAKKSDLRINEARSSYMQHIAKAMPGRNVVKDRYSMYSETMECSETFAHSNLQHSVSLKEFASLIKNYYLPKEKKKFLQRTGGRKFCGVPLIQFITPQNSQPPRKDCLYTVDDPQLTAQQVTDEVVLVRYIYPDLAGYDLKYIAIANDNPLEKNLVDGMPLPYGYFKYTGVMHYQSLIGQRSVYSFKRVHPDPFDGIYFYSGQ